MAGTKRKLTCKDCGAKFTWSPGAKGGRPPTRCPKHQRPLAGRKSGKPKPADKKRELARRRTKREGIARAATAKDHHAAARLAQALRLYPDPQHAATWVGIAPADIERVMELVRSSGGASDAVSAADRLAVGAIIIAETVIENRDEIAPRDLGHVVNALANARKTLLEKATANYSAVVVGVRRKTKDVADG